MAPRDLYLLVPMASLNILFMRNLLLTSGRWQSWGEAAIPDEQNTVNCLPASKVPCCILGWLGLKRQATMSGKPRWQRTKSGIQPKATQKLRLSIPQTQTARNWILPTVISACEQSLPKWGLPMRPQLRPTSAAEVAHSHKLHICGFWEREDTVSHTLFLTHKM